MKSNSYSREDLELLLPDYAFGKLDPNETAKFEAGVTQHPELQSEVEALRAVFKRVEAMNIPEIINQKTKNLSFVVNERRRAQLTTSRRRSVWLRFAIPAVACVALFVVFVNPTVFTKFWGGEKETGLSQDFVLFSAAEEEQLGTDGMSTDVFQAMEDVGSVLSTVSLSDFGSGESESGSIDDLLANDLDPEAVERPNPLNVLTSYSIDSAINALSIREIDQLLLDLTDVTS